jgi:hypothetical protein
VQSRRDISDDDVSAHDVSAHDVSAHDIFNRWACNPNAI